MGHPHWHHLAYLRGDDRAIAAISRLSPAITHAVIMPSNVRCDDGRPVLCIDVRKLHEVPDAVRGEIEGTNATTFDAFLVSEERAWADLDEQRARVRAMMWLSREIGGPVGYWHHEGDHGLNVELFLGFGPSPSMWANDCEWQVAGWDETKPRGAYTAAMWHIGARVPNLDEYTSLVRAVGGSQIPVDGLSAAIAKSMLALEANARKQIRRQRDVEALTRRLGQLFDAAPADNLTPEKTAIAKLSAWLRKVVSRN